MFTASSLLSELINQIQTVRIHLFKFPVLALFSCLFVFYAPVLPEPISCVKVERFLVSSPDPDELASVITAPPYWISQTLCPCPHSFVTLGILFQSDFLFVGASLE